MLRSLCTTLALTSVLSLAACGSSPDPAEDSDSSNLDDQNPTRISDAVVRVLENRFPGERGKTWSVTNDNRVSGDWIKQMPVASTWGAFRPLAPTTCEWAEGYDRCDRDFGLTTCTTDADCTSHGKCAALRATVAGPNQQPRSLCVGHSDEILDSIYDLITSANEFVDITSLTPPDGRFEATIRNAITRLAQSGRAVNVRMNFGDFPGQSISLRDSYDELVRNLWADTKSPIRITLGTFKPSSMTWNHSKVIAVDGKKALVGGMNLWTQHYLDANPVHDVSVLIEGSAAASAHRFANSLWATSCRARAILSFPTPDQRRKQSSDPERVCPTDFPAGETPTSGGARVVAVGRLGSIGPVGPSDDALLALIDASTTSLRILQQDLGPVKIGPVSVTDWPAPILSALVRAAARGVDIRIVMSNLDSVGGTPKGFGALASSYSNGWSVEDVFKKLSETAKTLPQGVDYDAALCKSVHLEWLRSSSSQAWPDGSKLALHSKVIAVDDRAFYVGSQNLYPADLAEFGYIIDDAALTRDFIASYLDSVAKFSDAAPAHVCGR